MREIKPSDFDPKQRFMGSCLKYAETESIAEEVVWYCREKLGDRFIPFKWQDFILHWDESDREGMKSDKKGCEYFVDLILKNFVVFDMKEKTLSITPVFIRQMSEYLKEGIWDKVRIMVEE